MRKYSLSEAKILRLGTVSECFSTKRLRSKVAFFSACTSVFFLAVLTLIMGCTNVGQTSSTSTNFPEFEPRVDMTQDELNKMAEASVSAPQGLSPIAVVDGQNCVETTYRTFHGILWDVTVGLDSKTVIRAKILGIQE